MKKWMLFVLLLPAAHTLLAQNIPFITKEDLAHWKNAGNDTVYVLNFWATWCQPCVEELPEFEKLHLRFADHPVQVILISTDFKRDVEPRVKPFVQRKKLQSHVVFMNDPTPNNYINLISPEWSGAIPATLIVSKKGERFFEKKMAYTELEEAVEWGLGIVK